LNSSSSTSVFVDTHAMAYFNNHRHEIRRYAALADRLFCA